MEEKSKRSVLVMLRYAMKGVNKEKKMSGAYILWEGGSATMAKTARVSCPV